MAVIGSRANGTRVPDDAVKGGGFGAALVDSGGVRNPQPASERRDVTILGRPGLGIGGRRPSGQAEDRDPPSLDARSSLFVAGTLDRARREWFETLDENEKTLDPLAASGFAKGIAQQFRDFSSKTLADMPESLRPHVASGLSRVGGELEMRARDFEDMASRVGIFNRTKQTLDDLTATVGIQRFDAPRILQEGRARIAAAPLGEGARRILGDYFLADLPLKTALAHIDDDPDDALIALRATDRGAGTEILAPRSLADGAAGKDGQFDPAMLYTGLAPEVRSGLEAQARITSARRRQGARLATVRRIGQGIAANSVSARDIERAGLDRADTARLKAKLETARANEQLTADAVERFVNKPESFDQSNAEDHAAADRAFRAIAGESITPGAALGIGSGADGDAVDMIDLAGRFAFDSRFLPDAAVEQLWRIVREGSAEERERAAAMLDEFNIPGTEDAVPPEVSGEADGPQPPSPHQPRPEDLPDAAPTASVEDPGIGSEEAKKDEDVSAFGVLLEVVDIVTDFVPVVSEGKAALRAFELSNELSDAMERGDEAAVRRLSADLALTMTDLLPGPNIAGTVRRIGDRADRIPLVRTLKEKLQRLLSKAKDPDKPDAKPTDAERSRTGTGGANPGAPEPEQPVGKQKGSQRRGPPSVNPDIEFPMTKEKFDELAFDPDTKRIDQKSTEELRTVLAAQRAGIIGEQLQRGGQGSDFVGVSLDGRKLEIDVKAPNADYPLGGTTGEQLRKLKDGARANPDEHYLIDPRHMSVDELQIVVDRMVNLGGIKRDRILIVEAGQFGVMIVGGERK